MINYESVGTLPDGSVKLKFSDGPFEDIIFTLGKVSFSEIGDELKLNYVYNVVEHHQEYDDKKFGRAVGDLLVQMLEVGVKNNDIVYTGGINENRRDDTSESNAGRGVLS